MIKKLFNKTFKIKKGIKAPPGYIAVELDVDKYHNKGIKYLDAGKYDKAIEMFKKEIACEPTCDIGYHSLGEALEKKGQKGEALKNYEKALKKAQEMKRRYPESIDERAIEEIKKDIARIGR